jgi:hypothetical protein
VGAREQRESEKMTKPRYAGANSNGGYALITVMLTIVTLLSAAFLLAYPLAHDAKEEANTRNSESKWQRFRHGLLGRQLEQAGGLYGYCSGYFSDMGAIATSGGGTENFSPRHVARRYYSHRGGTSDFIDEAPAWVFQNGFWFGFRGKHYVYPSPADLWDERYKNPQDTATCEFRWAMSVCQQPLKLFSNALFSTSERSSRALLGNMPSFFADVVVAVRDYGRDRGSRSTGNFRVVLGECGGTSAFLVPASADKETVAGKPYHLYVFSFDPGSDSLASSGLNKLHIQVRSGDTWSTRRTQAVVLPVEMVFEFGEYRSRDGSYIEIDYFG